MRYRILASAIAVTLGCSSAGDGGVSNDVTTSCPRPLDPDYVGLTCDTIVGSIACPFQYGKVYRGHCGQNEYILRKSISEATWIWICDKQGVLQYYAGGASSGSSYCSAGSDSQGKIMDCPVNLQDATVVCGN
jgi:hypothetical protein